RLAKKVSPRSRFVCSLLHDFELPACRAVTAIGEGLNYLLPEADSTRRLGPLFRRVAHALGPGGMFLFDVMVNEGPAQLDSLWREGKDWVVMVDFQQDRPTRLLTKRIITFRRKNGHWRRAEETHRVRLFERAEMLRNLREASFTVQVTRRYGTFALGPR